MFLQKNPVTDLCVLPSSVTTITAVETQCVLLPADSDSSMCSWIKDGLKIKEENLNISQF